MKKVISILLSTALIMVVFAGCTTQEPASQQINEKQADSNEQKAGETTQGKAQETAEGEQSQKVTKGRSERKVAISLGWTENEAGQRWKLGFEESIQQMGGNASYADAAYDPKKQSEQIEAFIKSDPDALIVVPCDPLGVAEAIRHATDSGIPVFLADNFVPNTAPVTWVTFDGFSIGVWTMDMLAKRLGGKGKIAMITLKPNEFWNLRTFGAEYILETKYPDIEVIETWDWDSTGVVTPRMAIDNMLTKYPNKGDLDAIWCCWDGAAFEGLQATAAAGRDDILFTGVDGGEYCLELLKANPNFVCSSSMSIYTEAYLLVKYMHEHLDGKPVPRVVSAPCIQLTKEVLDNLVIPEGYELMDYDKPGMLDIFKMPLVPPLGVDVN